MGCAGVCECVCDVAAPDRVWDQGGDKLELRDIVDKGERKEERDEVDAQGSRLHGFVRCGEVHQPTNEEIRQLFKGK